MINSIINGDCLEVMQSIPDKSVDMILCDLPYGTTACKWDTIIPFEPLWALYKRVIRDNGAIVLTASQPFTSALVMSNVKMFKYEWIWRKSRKTDFANAKNKPLKQHENVLVFSNGVTANGGIIKMKYIPQGVCRVNEKRKIVKGQHGNIYGERKNQIGAEYIKEFTNYPCSVLDVNNEGNKEHPTQKPVALFEYLIKTYTNEGETVLDNCSGSGTTAIACINTNRNYICIEKDKGYFDLSVERVNNHKQNLFNKAC